MAIKTSKSQTSQLSLRSRRRSRTSISFKDLEDNENYEPPTACKCPNCPIKNRRKLSEEQKYIVDLNMRKVYVAIDERSEESLEELAQLLRFQTVSVEPEQMPQSWLALDWFAERLERLKFYTSEYVLQKGELNCFDEKSKPKALFASYFSSPSRHTLFIYAHLDVVPAPAEGWLNDPFELYTVEGLLYGRGVCGGKGMAIGWLQAITATLKLHGDLPVNIKIVIDMMHEVGSVGLDELISAKSEWFLDVDYMIFDNNSWLNNETPIVSCSLSGWAYFGLELTGANKSLEGGLMGGLMYEPMTDMCHLLNSLVSKYQEPAMTTINDYVRKVSLPEWMLLQRADFSLYNYKEDLKIRKLRGEETRTEFLANRWCRSNLCMHGIKGAFSRPGCSQIMPMQLTGKFSIKLVPDQDVATVHFQVSEYLHTKRKDLHINTLLKLRLIDSCEVVHWNIDAARVRTLKRVLSDVYRADPIVTTSITSCLPIANVLHKMLNKPIILVPYTRRRDYHCLVNENIEEESFQKHIKVCAGLMFQLSKQPVKCKCDVIWDHCSKQGLAERLAQERNPTPPKRKLSTVLKQRLTDPLQRPKKPVNNRVVNWLKSIKWGKSKTLKVTQSRHSIA
ncbi:cytosolic non-specific dipeptidase-like [Drosophila busckii]|uniref:cytosolic non-specific dipeptidase-like n=1 Tax=Drosophila busckii TaxID=30019 RepID=UPI00083EF421|nr:cytosolic non-specific dipeptidase-like [Drosophila busckii]